MRFRCRLTKLLVDGGVRGDRAGPVRVAGRRAGNVLHTGALDSEEFRNGLARADAERRAGHLEDAARIARSALDLWRGEALGGLTGPIFEAARTRLHEERASAWELWAEIELSRGGFAGLVSELSRLVEEFPLREGLRAQLMIALYRSGRQAEALAAFRDAREFFLDELGAEPGERLQETHRQILHNEPFTAPPVPRVYDDGGLIDVNHAPEHVIATLSGINRVEAHQIVLDRHHNGPFINPDDLVRRGLVTPRTVRRLASRLICVPPESQAQAGAQTRELR
ncbi:MAG TPA: BTAD domain-containing putative transcriptional regulator [Actinoplanes sp.]|nr:BTAD domain-containing putative transcriptional regulator [Actinoplanes sp.]